MSRSCIARSLCCDRNRSSPAVPMTCMRTTTSFPSKRILLFAISLFLLSNIPKLTPARERSARSRPGRYCFSEQLISLLSPVVCPHVFLGFRGRLIEPLFIARLEQLTASWAAFVKQLRKEIAIPVFVEDQFAL